MKRRISQLVFDSKRDFVDIPRRCGPHWNHYCFQDKLRLGLGCPGVPVDMWANTLSTLVTVRSGLKAAWTCLANMLRWLVAVMNPNPRPPILWPDFSLLLEVTRSAPLTLWASKPDYEKSLINVLEAIVYSTGNLFRSFDGLSVERDLIAQQRSAVFDIATMSPPWIRNLGVDILLSQSMCYRIHNQVKMDRTEVVLTIDEADPLVSRLDDAEFPDGMTPVAEAQTKVRELGVMLIIGARLIGYVSRLVLNGGHIVICLDLQDSESAVEGARLLGLPLQASQMLIGPRPGEAIIRQAQSSWRQAMAARIDYVEPYRGEPPQFDENAFVPAKPLAELPHVQAALEERIREHEKTQLRQKRGRRGELSALAHDLLSLAAMHPYIPCVRLWEKMNRVVSPGQRKSVRTELTQAGLSAFFDARLGKSSRILIELTDKGYEFLHRPVNLRRGGGSILHRHAAHWLAMLAQKDGCEVRIEYLLDGTNHIVDVLRIQDGRLHAFEICIGCTHNLCQHAIACLVRSSAIETMTVVAPLKSSLSSLERLLVKEPALSAVQDRIRFESLENILEELSL